MTPSVSNMDVTRTDSLRSSSRTIGGFRFNPIDTIVTVSGRARPYKSVAEYDSAQKTLPVQDRDNWLVRQFTKSNIERVRKYGGQRDSMINSIIDTFYHRFPYLLFVSLPLSAFFLQILYFRNRNNVYSGHAIFLVYLYIFTFLSLLVYFGLDKIESSFNLGWIGWLKFALFVYIGLYTLFAFKRYYAQGWGKTLFKFIVWNILAFITIVILFVIFFLISLMTV